MNHLGTTRVQRTRERLCKTAYRLFLQQGYQATTIEAILAEAGISSKEALFVDVLNTLTRKNRFWFRSI